MGAGARWAWRARAAVCQRRPLSGWQAGPGAGGAGWGDRVCVGFGRGSCRAGPVAAGGVCKGRLAAAEQPDLGFADLLRQLRAEARLTQEELAEAAGLSPRAVSDLERGFHRTAHKDTAVLLADALGLAGPARELFVAAARGKAPAAEVLVAARSAGPQLLEAAAASPYRGLAMFGEQDTALFFGREASTAQVLERMSCLLAGAGMLVVSGVSGVSGAGKSSLLRAGVLPRIRAAGLAAAPGAGSWPCALFTPTRAPLDELALRVAPLAGADAAAVRRGLAADPAGFALTARQAALARPPGPPAYPNGSAAERDQPSPRRLLLVVDQFEELFTQCPDEGQRRAFITALHAAATAGHGPDQAPAALVVLGVRADFEARCADYPQLADPVQDRYLVTAMTERQLRMAITEPSKKAGSRVDDDLVGVLLTGVRNGQPGTFGAGVLPLLSHALDQAWRHRTGEAVTLADYERAGGIEGAVAGSAQRAYDRLTPGQQAAARQVFLRLTATSSDGVDTADRATRAELTEGKNTAEAQDVEECWRPSPPNACSPWRPEPWRSATRRCSRRGRCCVTAGWPTPTPTGSFAPGCTTPPPNGPVTPATRPTSTAAACSRPPPAPPPGSAPTPPATHCSARPNRTSCSLATVRTGAGRAVGRASWRSLLPWS
jgi:transcriptional regulator with XRE-family HTH domain